MGSSISAEPNPEYKKIAINWLYFNSKNPKNLETQNPAVVSTIYIGFLIEEWSEISYQI